MFFDACFEESLLAAVNHFLQSCFEISVAFSFLSRLFSVAFELAFVFRIVSRCLGEEFFSDLLCLCAGKTPDVANFCIFCDENSAVFHKIY